MSIFVLNELKSIKMDNQSMVLTPVPIGELIKAISADLLAKLAPILNQSPSTNTDKDPQYVTRKEAAKILRVSVQTLGKYTAAGTIKGYRISGGRQVRYVETELRQALDKFQTV